MLQLIIFTGLPGTGKSSLAEAVGRQLGIPVFAKDWLEATLLRCRTDSNPEIVTPLGYVGYELLTTLAQRQLMLGQSAILDSVASTQSIRDKWRDLAAAYNASWNVIECICSDEAVHRAQLATRQRHIPGWHELTWAEVERVKAYYVAWREDHLILDMINSLDDNIQQALAYLKNAPQR